MRAIPPTPVSTSHTRAWQAFEQNLDSIVHMLSMGGRELSLAKTEAIRFTTFLSKPRDLTTKATTAKLIGSVERYVKTLQARRERFGTATLWQVVMLVTCVEAYLQDLLSAAASVDTELMSKSQQLAPYNDVIAANSLDELANELRTRWARGWLSDGGPTRWISRFERMGARGYPEELAPRLELIWGIRHVVVHTAGIATADFVKRHPGIVKATGVRLRLNNKDFETFLKDVIAFMEPIEKYFLVRYPEMIAAAFTDPA